MIRRAVLSLAMLIAFCSLALPQTTIRQNLKTLPGYFIGSIGNVTATPSTDDSTADFKPGGFNLSSITIASADTIRDTAFVQLSVDGGTTWATIASQILLSTGATLSYEIVLRDNDSDLLDSIPGLVHISHHPAATSNGSAGSYPVVTHTLNFKP